MGHQGTSLAPASDVLAKAFELLSKRKPYQKKTLHAGAWHNRWHRMIAQATPRTDACLGLFLVPHHGRTVNSWTIHVLRRRRPQSKLRAIPWDTYCRMKAMVNFGAGRGLEILSGARLGTTTQVATAQTQNADLRILLASSCI